MKTLVLIIGEKYKFLPEFRDYLLRNLYDRLSSVDGFLYLRENDPNILMEMELLIQKGQNILVVAAKQSFTLASKMIATHMADTLTLKGELLIPSKASVYTHDSYLVELANKRINVVRVGENGELGEILLDDSGKNGFIHLFSLDEESASILLAPIAQANDVALQSFRHPGGWVGFRTECKRYGNLANFFNKASTLLPGKVVASTNIVAWLIEKLRSNGQTLTAAESCTGGRIASLITAVAGSSDVFTGSVVTYSNEIKQSWLGVDEEILATYGAVSQQTVEKMLLGSLGIAKTDYALAASGIAGPSGATATKPIGTVFVGAISSSGVQKVELLHLQGDRNYIQMASAYHAIRLLVEILLESEN